MLNSLPQLQDWLIIANSTPLPTHELDKLAIDKKIMVLDGAYNFINNLELKIDILLGDFDSVDPEILKQAYKDGVLVKHIAEQESTDLEKGLHYLATLPDIGTIFICNAVGLRLDHTLFNLRILKKYHDILPALVMISEQEIIRYAKNSVICIKGTIGDTVSLLGFPNARISTHGLKYEVSDFELKFAFNESISNVLVKDEATVEIDGEALIIHKN